MLTPRQKQLYDFLCSQARAGTSPTYAEIRSALGLQSNSSAQWQVSNLVDRGFIRCESRTARGIQVLIPCARLAFVPLERAA